MATALADEYAEKGDSTQEICLPSQASQAKEAMFKLNWSNTPVKQENKARAQEVRTGLPCKEICGLFMGLNTPIIQ